MYHNQTNTYNLESNSLHALVDAINASSEIVFATIITQLQNDYEDEHIDTETFSHLVSLLVFGGEN